MNSFLCELWPYLAGGLTCWLLVGWFARRQMYSEPPAERIVEKEDVKTVDNPEHLKKTSSLEGEQNLLKTGSSIDLKAAKAAGFKVRQKNDQDNFTIIEGIGPKINDLIHAAGIHTFSELSNTLVEDIQKILDKAGANFKLTKPETWPAQSEMAATNRWDRLKAWQDELDGDK